MRALSTVGMIVFVVLSMVAILFLVDASYAQDATETVAAPTAVVTVEPLPAPEVPPVVVVPTPTPANWSAKNCGMPNWSRNCKPPMQKLSV